MADAIASGVFGAGFAIGDAFEAGGTVPAIAGEVVLGWSGVAWPTGNLFVNSEAINAMPYFNFGGNANAYVVEAASASSPISAGELDARFSVSAGFEIR